MSSYGNRYYAGLRGLIAKMTCALSLSAIREAGLGDYVAVLSTGIVGW